MNTFEKLEKFVGSGKLYEHYMMAMDHQGIMGLGITGYGVYGLATRRPIRTVVDARKIKIRTAEASVNQSMYRQWGFNPVVMPWPEVSTALKQSVIDALDHTPTVCNITKKFEFAKYYSHLDYSQGIFIWIFNKNWINRLPVGLQETFKQVVHDVCGDIRRQTIQEELDQIEFAKKGGVEFIDFNDADMALLKQKADAVHQQYRNEINSIYAGDRYRPSDYLKEVEDYLGYDPSRYLSSDRNRPSAGSAATVAAISSPRESRKADRTPPEIVITSHEASRGIGIVEKKKKTTISGKAVDPSGIVEVIVDGQQAYVDESGNFQASVLLKYGDNRILISAMDRFENVATRQLTITRADSAKLPPAAATADVNQLLGWYKRQYALVIGIDRYQSQDVEKLQNAVSDAKSMGKMFRRMGFEVVELYNEAAERARILRSFSTITKNLRQPDSFVFYFAGHGQGFTLANGERVGYILPHDAQVSLKEVDIIQYDSECIPISTIKKYSKNMKAKHIALIFDSCFSGLAMKRSVMNVGNVDIEYYNDLLSRKVINILTAGDDQPVSDGTKHSPFTMAILEGLERKSLDINDRDGYVTFNQLSVYVKEKVEKATGRRQRPQFDNLSLEDGDFIFKVR